MGALALVLVAASGASAGEAESGTALRMTVHPSGVEPDTGAETLDEKLARRLRQSDAMFRHICTGCVRADGTLDGGTFEPIRTLGKPMPVESRLPAPDEE